MNAGTGSVRKELVTALERAVIALEFIAKQEDGKWLIETIRQCKSAISRSREG